MTFKPFLAYSVAAALALVIASNGPKAASTMADWQISFPAFAARVKEKRAEYGAILEPGSLELLSVLSVGGCANDKPVLPGFGLVQFAAKFKSAEELKDHPNPQVIGPRKKHKANLRIKLDIDGNLPEQHNIGFFIYAAADAEAAWRALAADAPVVLKANVNCIKVSAFPRDPSYMVTLHEARP